MPVTATEVDIRFRRPPHDVFGIDPFAVRDSLRFRIWPETAVGLTLAGKKPGGGMEPLLEDLTFAGQPGSDMRPYDRLIGAALDGDRWLFARQDTVEAAWEVVDPVLGDVGPVHPYARGSWGPEEADRLLPEPGHLARPGWLNDGLEQRNDRPIWAAPRGDRGRRLRRPVRGPRAEAQRRLGDHDRPVPAPRIRSRCSTSARPASCPRGRSPPRCAICSRSTRTWTCVMAEVTDFDVAGRRVIARRVGGDRLEFGYDELIVAAGVRQSYFGHDEFARWAPGMKTISDALDHPPPGLRRVRDGPDGGDPGGTPRLADVRPGRGRPDRRRAGGPAPGGGHHHAAPRVPDPRAGGRAGPAVRRRQRAAGRVRPETVAEGRQQPGQAGGRAAHGLDRHPR